MSKNRTSRSKSKKVSVAPVAAPVVAEVVAPVVAEVAAPVVAEVAAPVVAEVAQVAAPVAAAPIKINVLTVGHDDIARRAYELFLQRGGGFGDPLADWLRAETELRSYAA